MINKLVSLSTESRTKLTDYALNTCVSRLSNIETLRGYYYQRDLAYNRLPERKAKEDADTPVDEKEYDKLVVPVVLSQVKSIQAALNGIFTSRTPIFQAIAGKEFNDEANIINALNTRYARLWQWRRNLSLALSDGVKYNIFGCEVDWKEHKRFVYVNGPADKPNEKKLTETVWAGTAITRIDPYNLIFDARVIPAEMHMYGEFAGSVEFYSKARFEKFWQENRTFLFTDNKPAITANTLAKRNYFVPSLGTGSDARVDNGTDWSTFWDSQQRQNNANNANYSYGVEVLRLFVRIIPADFQINVPDAKRLQIWKLIFAGDRLVHASPYQANHNFLPILLGQPSEDGLGYQTRSVAESVEDIQKLASSLWNAEIEATRRVVSDRGIYDPSLVAPKHMNNPNSSAKIPMRRAAYNVRPADTYYQIPYNDPALGARLQQSSAAFAFANQVTGRNPVAQGQFVKGNKTNEQFQESMAASEARIIDMAIMLEDQFFGPLKYMLLENILEHQKPEELYDSETQALLKVNPDRLRDAVLEFEVADGLFGADKLAGLTAFVQSFQASLAIPAIAAEYDVPGAIGYIAELSGAKHFKDYKLTAEQRKAKLIEQAQAQAALSAGQSAGTAAGQAVVQQPPQGAQQ